MSEKIWTALQRTSSADLKRRVTVVHALLTDTPRATVAGAERFAHHNGHGDSAVWYFTADGRILLITQWHKSELNTYGDHDEADEDFAVQESYFDGVPADLVALVRNQPETTESFNISTRLDGSIHSATGVFWFDRVRWRVADGLVEHCRRKNVDLYAESGLCCIGSCLLGEEFTPERYFAHHRCADDLDGVEGRGAMDAIRAAFASVAPHAGPIRRSERCEEVLSD
ncbi:hypothetical protein [Streptomyces sp. NPDC007929]|uniref:hypothetical protein n=1 Tax=unclassified Streptomyces TaxID=2593676 RepID=UPI0036EAA2ED